MKAQLKAADRSGATVALLVGPQELEAGAITIRDLRATSDGDRQRQIARQNVVEEVLRTMEMSKNA